MSQLKIKDGNNWINIPSSGIGVPSGGTTGQVLQKSSNTDYATEWANLPVEQFVDRSADVTVVQKVDTLKLLVKGQIAYLYIKTQTAVNGFVQLAQLPSDLYPAFYRVPSTVYFDSTSDASKNCVGVVTDSTDNGKIYIRTSSSTSGVVHLEFIYPIAV